MVLSSYWVIWGGGITPLGWFYPPFSVILSPHLAGGEVVTLLGVWPISMLT